MSKAKSASSTRSNTELRSVILYYFYERNRNASSLRGKKGAAVRISDIKRDLKAQGSLTPQQVVSNLTYLQSQGWIEEIEVKKEFRSPQGIIVPSVTAFYRITAAGIDKIEGPGGIYDASVPWNSD